LLPEKYIPARLERGKIVPFYLGPDDFDWLRELVAEIDSFTGRPLQELDRRLEDEPRPAKARAAAWLLKRYWRAQVSAEVDPPAARTAVFVAAAAGPRASALSAAAEELRVEVPALEASLFADLPGERVLHRPAEVPGIEEIALRTNLAAVRGLLLRTSEVRIRVESDPGPLVRAAKQNGLICVIEGKLLTISGPYALFRRTLLYGHALGDLVSSLPFGENFELSALCAFRGRMGELTISPNTPLFAGATCPRERKVTQRFAADFPGPGLERNPPPIADGRIYPDFRLPSGIYVEILGFWTHAQLAERARNDLIVCVDEERQCGDGTIPDGVIGYRKRIDVARVLAEAAARIAP
jgi:predicted nuclease of restriction endonuclease-like RecB superfamily